MNSEESPGISIWQRQVSTQKAAFRWRKFATYYGGPLVIALVLTLIFKGPGEMLGVLILFGSIGVLLGLAIGLYNLSLAANPEIRLIEGHLVLGRNKVKVSTVEAWTTERHVSGGDSYGPAATVRFRVPFFRDGQRGLRPDGGPAFGTVVFGWPEMTTEELASVRLALQPHIDTAWVPPERMND